MAQNTWSDGATAKFGTAHIRAGSRELKSSKGDVRGEVVSGAFSLFFLFRPSHF